MFGHVVDSLLGQSKADCRLLLASCVVDNHHRVNAATNVEVALDTRSTWLRGGDQIIQDLVGDGLVKRSLVAVGPQVELPRFQFHAKSIRNVFHANRREVRLPSFGAQTSEFGTLETNDIVPILVGIGESLKVLGRSRCHRAVKHTRSQYWTTEVRRYQGGLAG